MSFHFVHQHDTALHAFKSESPSLSILHLVSYLTSLDLLPSLSLPHSLSFYPSLSFFFSLSLRTRLFSLMAFIPHFLSSLLFLHPLSSVSPSPFLSSLLSLHPLSSPLLSYPFNNFNLQVLYTSLRQFPSSPSRITRTYCVNSNVVRT